LSATASSDTELLEGEIIIPSCDVLLDNSKTLSYGGGAASNEDEKPPLHRSISSRERNAWRTFK